MNKLPNDYQNFIALSRYARWLPEKNRRENWEETVARYFNFMEEHLKENTDYELDTTTRRRLEHAVLTLQIMPSMRALMTAGPALAKNHIAGYNCAYLSVDHPKAFDECLYVLMHGTGVGFSVERQHINKLPEVPEEILDVDDVIVVQDSKEGWQSAFRKLITYLYDGENPKWDFSRIRKKGARLKIFGGRASGPEPLVDLFHFTSNIFKDAAGRKLTSYECHRLMCKVAEVVVVGGVRRSALISLSNLTDERMRNAKSGQWWSDTPEMALSNNSVCYTEKPDMSIFMKEWTSLYESKSGERGIFNRQAAIEQVKSIGRRDPEHDFGCNPCSEIILRDGQFCNLTEVVIRAEDTQKEIIHKVKMATILGTFQASLTNIRRLRPKWVKNTEEEALLGVSLTGIMDNSFMNGTIDRGHYGKKDLPDFLIDLKKKTVDTNKDWSEKLGISQATATTAIKPSGTVSQLVDSASGIHTRHNDYYLRRVRADSKDPIAQLMKDQGIPCEDDVMKPNSVKVFTFPMKAPKGAILRNDRSAIEQLKLWLTYQRYYCEHKPSVTISVKEHEWMEVGAWVYKHFDEVSGVSFLPHSDHSYQQAPYEDCTKAEYTELAKKMPKSVDWNLISQYELEDTTVGNKTLACTGSVCELVDLVEEDNDQE
jgi:ribonucleoside-triphosphate reductase (thioredoxin)